MTLLPMQYARDHNAALLSFPLPRVLLRYQDFIKKQARQAGFTDPEEQEAIGACAQQPQHTRSLSTEYTTLNPKP